MNKKLVKIVTTVPVSHANRVRQAAGDALAGRLGNYSHASFSTKGTGRFLPLDGANPSIGAIGRPEAVEEERIEWTCEAQRVKEVVNAVRRVHPYEEPVIDVYPLETL